MNTVLIFSRREPMALLTFPSREKVRAVRRGHEHFKTSDIKISKWVMKARSSRFPIKDLR